MAESNRLEWSNKGPFIESVNRRMLQRVNSVNDHAVSDPILGIVSLYYCISIYF